MSHHLIIACVLLTTSVANGCIWTNSHCACSKKSALLGESSCYDLIADIPGSEKKKCSSRKCRESYVCDCDGKSYCEHSSGMKEVLVSVGNDECIITNKDMTTVALHTVDITKVHPGAPGKNSNCFFSDTECTCASTTDIGITQDCLDFLYEDPIKGSVCRVRDCKDSMQCDCGGSSRCSRTLKTSIAWRNKANEGRPGFALCERFESTAYQVTKIMSEELGEAVQSPASEEMEEKEKEAVAPGGMNQL